MPFQFLKKVSKVCLEGKTKHESREILKGRIIKENLICETAEWNNSSTYHLLGLSWNIKDQLFKIIRLVSDKEKK